MLAPSIHTVYCSYVLHSTISVPLMSYITRTVKKRFNELYLCDKQKVHVALHISITN